MPPQDPLPLPDSNVITPEEFLRRDAAPTSYALTRLYGNPDEAGQAAALGRVTNTPPSVISLDPEHFLEQHKAALTQQIFENNPHLRDYVAVHPFGADVSSDDWGQLDKISGYLGRFFERHGVLMPSTIGAFARGFGEAHGPGFGATPEQLQAMDRISTNPSVAKTIHALMATQGPFASVTHAAAELERIIGGGMNGLSAAAEQWYLNQTGDPVAARKFATDMAIWPQVAIPELGGGIVEAATASRMARPWLETGGHVPTKLLPPEIVKDQTKRDMDGFDHLFKESKKSSTLNRPGGEESFRTYLDVLTGDETIGISADKVRELYGDGRPEPGDNKLGWAPGIDAQFDRALSSGYDVEVPWKDFLTEASEETYDIVHDGIRVRHDGATLDEAKEVKPVKPPEGEPPPPPHETLSKIVGHEWEAVEGGLADQPKPLEGGAPAEMEGYDYEAHERTTGQSTATFLGKDILRQLDLSDLPADANVLSTFWQKTLARLAGDTKVHIAPRDELIRLFRGQGTDFDGLHWSHTGDVYLPEDLLNQSNSRFTNVVLHELAHSVTVGAIEKFPEIKAKIRGLMDEMGAHHESIGTPDYQPGKGFQGTGRPYAFQNEKEFIAEGVADGQFRRELQRAPVSKELAAKLGLPDKPGNTFWDAVRQIVKDLWTSIVGKAPETSVMDAFFRAMEHIEEANKTLKGMAEGAPEAMARPEAMAAEDPELGRIFQNGRALGMTIKRLESYMKLAKDQLGRDAKVKRDQAQMEEGAKATQEWKDNEARVRGEVKDDLISRPDIAADRFLRTSELPSGEKLRGVKLDPQAIDPEIRDKIPEEFFAEGGVSPDALAPVFRFQSGDQLVRSLARLNDERKLADLTPAGHLRGLVDQETQRQMLEKYGVGPQDIIDRAKEHIVNPTRLDMMTMEYHAIAEANGETPLSEAQLKKEAKRVFNGAPVGTHSSDKYIEAMGRESDKFEQAYLEGKGNDAFIAKQRLVLLGHQLKLALDMEKKLKSFDTRNERWLRRSPPSMMPEDAVWLHEIERKIGFEDEFSLQDLERRKAMYTRFKSLREYVNYNNKGPRGVYNSDPDAPATVAKMPVADFLLDDDYHATGIHDMLPPEFEAVYDSLRTIDHFSRDQHTSMVKGKREEVAGIVAGMVARIKASAGDEPITKGRQKESARRNLGSLLLTPETWFNDLDAGNRLGPFNQLIVRPLMEGQYTLQGFKRRFAKMWRELGELDDYSKKIENPGLWLDPKDGFAIDMNKDMAYGILQNMGNELQRKKLLLGWKIAKNEAELPEAEAKVWAWLKTIVTEEDLTRAQEMGDIFGEAFSEVEKARQQLSGVAPARIDLYTVKTPWGEKKEWFHPLIPDPLRYRHTPEFENLFDDGYHRPAPAAGHIKERTGAIYPLDLSLQNSIGRLKQELNDAAMTVPINEVGKIIYHPDFQEAFAKYVGKEYQGALDQWIRDLAGNRQWTPSNVSAIQRIMTGIQDNLSTLMIGWNLATVLKHGPTAAGFSAAEVGAGRFAKHLGRIIYELPGSREAWNFAMETSEELQNRMHSTIESMAASDRDMFPSMKGKFASFRETMQRIGATPVGWSDLISSVAMWNAEFERLGELHPDMSFGDKVYDANTAVRRTHGSSLLASRTQALRAGPMARGLMPFYNFFSNALQRNFEGASLAAKHARGLELPEMPGFEREMIEKDRGKAAKVLLGTLLVYGVMPSIVESGVELLTGQYDPDESWGSWGARSLVQALPNQVPVVRDIVGSLWRGYDPSLGLYGTLARDVRDVTNPKAWLKDPGTFLRRANEVGGLLTGMGYDPVGRAGQFWLNVMTGDERPRSPWDYWKGTLTGTAEERRRR